MMLKGVLSQFAFKDEHTLIVKFNIKQLGWSSASWYSILRQMGWSIISVSHEGNLNWKRVFIFPGHSAANSQYKHQNPDWIWNRLWLGQNAWRSDFLDDFQQWAELRWLALQSQSTIQRTSLLSVQRLYSFLIGDRQLDLAHHRVWNMFLLCQKCRVPLCSQYFWTVLGILFVFWNSVPLLPPFYLFTNGWTTLQVTNFIWFFGSRIFIF